MTDHQTPARGSLLALGCWLNDLAQSVPDGLLKLLLRLGIASVFFKSGLVKLASWQSTVMLFEMEYRVPVVGPETAAVIAAIFELGMPPLLALGLFTRLAALPLLGMTAVIEIFVYPLNWSEHLIWASILLFLVCRGPGGLSLDHFLRPRLLRLIGR